MTYLFKLARRLSSACIAIPLVLAACSEPAPRDFLEPEPPAATNPNAPVSLHIAPHAGTLAFGQTLRLSAWARTASGDSVAAAVSWTASGGLIGPDGMFQASASGQHVITAFATAKPSLKASTSVTVGEPGSIFTSLTVLPEPVVVTGGSSVAFAVTAKLASTGANTVPAVTWATNGGTITGLGEFTATMTPGTYEVTATTLDGKLSDVASVIVQEAELRQLRLSPEVVIMPGGATQDFLVTAGWSDGSEVVPVLEWQTNAGTIVPISGPQGVAGGNGNGGGRLQGGTTPGNYKVIARHPHSGVADTSIVTITPTLAEVILSPAEADLTPGGSKSFSAKGRMTDGAIVNLTVSWAATGGNVSASGVYTAGTSGGTYRVVARTTDGSLADTAEVRIAQPAATLTRLDIVPGSATVATGSIFPFAAQATWSDGSSNLPALAWSAQAGTITPDGRWTAPGTAGSYRVIVRDAGGTLADTALMTVEVPPPSLATLAIAPGEAEVSGGATVQFTAAATWTNGSTTVPPLAWSATGGTMGQDGKWVAPANYSGTFKVVARHSGGTLADTSTVHVTEVPRVTGISVTPGVAAMSPGDTREFSATATWSDGASRSVEFIWSATGGAITMQGLFTAGNLAGQFMVIAGCAGCAVTDTVSVTISEPVEPPPVVLTALVLNPASVSMNPGEVRALTVAATWSDGSTTVPALAWDATGGTLSGLNYTAGATAGNYRVIVRHQGGTLADTMAVTVLTAPAAPADTLVRLRITPDSASVPSGFSAPFTVSGTTSSGATVTPAVTWSATGGSITSAGVFTAGPASGAFRVIAACQGCALADTAVVYVGSAAPPAAADQVPLALQRLDGGTGTVLVSNGVPLAPGMLQPGNVGAVRVLLGGQEVPAYVEVLKGKHKDGSARSVLVQFTWPAGGATQATLELNAAPSQPRLAKTAITALMPSMVALPTDPEYLVRTEVVGRTVSRATSLTQGPVFSKYEADFRTWSDTHWGLYGGTTPGTTQWTALNYYDRALSHFAFWARTGDPELWRRAALIATAYRVNYLEANSFGTSEMWAQMEGLAVHYWLTGDERARMAVYKTAESLHRSRGGTRMANTWDHLWMDNRNHTKVLSGKVLAMMVEAPAFGVISDWAAEARKDLPLILSTQTAEGSYRFYSQCGESSNFMTGMLNDAYVLYYEHFEADSRIPAAIKKSLDWLWSTQWSATARAFNYYSGNCPNIGGPTPYADLNGMFLEAWGWYYRHSGDAAYRSQGEQILQGGVAGAWLQGTKQYNQHYMHSWRYLWYR